MADKNILIKRLVSAGTNDAKSRTFVHTAELENGAVFSCGARSQVEGQEEAFNVAVPATGAIKGLWMAAEPEVVVTKAGDKIFYKGLNPDVRNFSNLPGYVFTGIKLEENDIIVLTGGAVLEGTYVAGTTLYVNATADSTGLTWGATATANALSLKLVEESYVSITDGSVIGATQRVPAFIFEVVSN